MKSIIVCESTFCSLCENVCYLAAADRDIIKSVITEAFCLNWEVLSNQTLYPMQIFCSTAALLYSNNEKLSIYLHFGRRTKSMILVSGFYGIKQTTFHNNP